MSQPSPVRFLLLVAALSGVACSGHADDDVTAASSVGQAEPSKGADPAKEEPKATTQDVPPPPKAAPSSPVCGAVRYTGHGQGITEKHAVEAAREDALKECQSTPTFCGVDCESGVVESAKCAPLEAQDEKVADDKLAATLVCEIVFVVGAT
jgi:hypothetical protein